MPTSARPLRLVHPVPDPAQGSQVIEVTLDRLTLPALDDELRGIWPSPQKSKGDADRIAHFMSRDPDGYAPIEIDDRYQVVDPDGEVRIEAARSLGLTTVRCRVVERVADPIQIIARKLQREHWPTSRIIALMTSPVMWRRFDHVVEAARARMLAGRPSTTRAKSRDIIAAEIGLPGKGRYLTMVQRARERLGDAYVDGIARGEVSRTLDAIEHDLKRASRAEPPRTPMTTGWRTIWCDFWEAPPNRGEYGVPWLGGVPNETIAHAIETYTERGDLVVDPMAGSGRTIDIARELGRRCIAADQRPTRRDIRRWRIERGPIPRVRDARLVILDPPYWSIMHDQYGEGSSSGLPWREFTVWLRAMARSAYAMTASDGHAVSYTMNVRDTTSRAAGPRRMLRREQERAMEEAGWVLVDEIVVATPTRPTQAAIDRAQQRRDLLGRAIFMQIWRR